MSDTPVFNKIYEECDVNKTDMNLLFAVKGIYRIVVTATDNLGATGYDSMEFSVENVCSEKSDCPDCPDCPDIDNPDCTEAISLAIKEYIREHQVVDSTNPALTIVTDGRNSDSAKGELKVVMRGNISTSETEGHISGALDGNISGGTIFGGIGGNMSGKIKK
jgi:hypothetical protein